MKNVYAFLIISILCILFIITYGSRKGPMKLTSPAFNNNEYIPLKYTCDGEDINPPLIIESVPNNVESLALIVDDPDAPMGTWVHWIVWNISPTIGKIQENSIPGQEGRNNFDKLHYGGPCPPSGEHRYFFKLYALAERLGLNPGATKTEVEDAIHGKILATAELIGLYKRS